MVTLAGSERFPFFFCKITLCLHPSAVGLESIYFPKKKELDDNKQNVFLHSSPGPSRYCLI